MPRVVLACASVVAFCSIASADPVSTTPADTPLALDVAATTSADRALSSIAAADPLAVATTHEEPTAPATYVEGALATGYNNGYFLGGGAVEIGRHVSSFASVHGTVMSGLAGLLFENGSGSITQARVGADLFTCNTPDRLCAYGGADVGVQSTHYSGDGCNVFEEPCYPSDHVDKRDTSAVEVARAGIDAGGKHVRWRLGLEASFVDGHLNGMDAINAIAYRF